MKNRFCVFILILVFVISLSNFVFATDCVVTGINITLGYTNNTTDVHVVTGTLQSSECDTVRLKITSGADSTGLEFTTNNTGTEFLHEFFVNLDSTGWKLSRPNIKVNNFETVTISNMSGTISDTIIFDNISPVLGSITSIAATTGKKHNNFISGNFNIAFSLATDDTPVPKYTIYGVPVTSNINNYASSTSWWSSSVSPITVTLSYISDGNYFFVLDAEDSAGNTATSSSVIATKQNIYVDNTEPEKDMIKIGEVGETLIEKNIDSQNKIYFNNNNFSIKYFVSDVSGINVSSSKMYIDSPIVSLGYVSFSEDSFLYTYDDSVEFDDGEQFTFDVEAYDNVDNLLEETFYLVYDFVEPSDVNISSLSVGVNRAITITWEASVDSLSGISYYDIYRRTTNFNKTIPSGEPLETVTTINDRTYTDSSSKSANTVYYYGVVAVDKAGNKSIPLTKSINSGPSITIDIEDGKQYAIQASNELKLTFSSDVNSIKLSCNASTWSDYISVSGTSHTMQFNITSGSGCTTTNGDKTVYVKAFSENDYPDRVSIAADNIYYDNTKPTTPTNVTIIENTNGSVRVSWNESTDDHSGLDEYRLYYSINTDNVTLSSDYFPTTNIYYVYAPNLNQKVYFKVAAVDNAGNISNLSSTVSGNTTRYGPLFIVNITPSNKINNIYYVGGKELTIAIVADENLSVNPKISVRSGSSAFQDLSVSGNNRSFSVKHIFTSNGDSEIRVSGTNLQNETSQEVYQIKVKISEPSFDFDYSVSDEGLFSFNISNVSQDVYNVKYFILDNQEICSKQIDFFQAITENVFNCVFDSTTIEDGTYELKVTAFDAYSNSKTKTESIQVRNVDENKKASDEFIKKILPKIESITEWTNILTQLLIDIPEIVFTNLDLIISKKDLADQRYNEQNYVLSRQIYSEIDILINEIEDNLPEKKEVRKETIVKEFNEEDIEKINYFTKNEEIVTQTTELYNSKSISLERIFSIYEINQKKYFVVSLVFKNSSSETKTITIVEDVPSSFTNDVKNLAFNRDIEVLSANPLIKDVLVIPSNSEKTIIYSLIKPITEVDAITKFNLILSQFSNPIVLSGDVQKENIIYTVPANYKFLIYVFGIMIFILFVLIVFGLIAKSKKMKSERITNSKVAMNEYLSKSNDTKKEQDVKSLLNQKQTELSSKQKDAEIKKKFEEDYNYVMSAIKKRL